MSITELLLNNFTTICLVIGLAIITTVGRMLDTRTNRSFIMFVILIVVLLISNSIEYYLSELGEISVWRYITSAVGYTLRPTAVAIFITVLLRRRKVNILIWTPVILVGLIAFTTYFTHLMFWFNTYNFFMRGPLCYISHIVGGLYLVALVGLIIKMHNYMTAGEVFTVIYIAVMCVTATVLESLLSGYKFLLTGAMAISCMLYYIIVYMDTSKRDALTGLMNRRSFYMDFKKIRKKSLAIISIDLNNLKEINDSLGHSQGDKALQSLSKAMLVKSGKKFVAYRMGGDEFMAIGKGQTEENVKVYINDMRDALKKDNLTASFGSAFYKIGDNFDDVCNQADAQMYGDKSKYKHRSHLRV